VSRTFYEPIDRNVWSRDEDGIPWTSLHNDETNTFPVDFTDELDSGESVSSVSVDSGGVTVSESLSTPVVTLTVSGTGLDGFATVKATTSDRRFRDGQGHNQRQQDLGQDPAVPGRAHGRV
jgi:hypothetical protein